MPERSRSRQGGKFGDKVVSEVRDAANETLFEGTTEGGERRRAKGAMPVGHETRCRQRLHEEKRRRGRRERCRMGVVGRRDTEGTDKCHRSAFKALTPVRKGKAAEGESKNEQEELVKMA